MKKVRIRTTISENVKAGAGIFRITFPARGIARLSRPGQFVMVHVAAGTDTPLLRRPLGVHAVSGGRVTLLYEVVGPATQLLSLKRKDDQLDVIGPLGNGFDLKSAGRPVIIAGGMGAAPLFFLAAALGARRPLVLLGAKTASRLVGESGLKKMGCEVHAATEDGTRGYRGYVTALLERFLQKGTVALKTAGCSIYACGPRPMLAEVAAIAARCRIPAQVSLEEHMACGVGACMGCTVKTASGYQRVCSEGPVFDSREIEW